MSDITIGGIIGQICIIISTIMIVWLGYDIRKRDREEKKKGTESF